jgi:hypothetical protein
MPETPKLVSDGFFSHAQPLRQDTHVLGLPDVVKRHSD